MLGDLGKISFRADDGLSLLYAERMRQPEKKGDTKDRSHAEGGR